MAVYLSIKKIDETPTEARYTFTASDEVRTGQFSINKESGETMLVQGMSGDTKNSLYYAAAYKVKKALRSGNLPESTYYAA